MGKILKDLSKQGIIEPVPGLKGSAYAYQSSCFPLSLIRKATTVSRYAQNLRRS
jgi:hypothetical protein